MKVIFETQGNRQDRGHAKTFVLNADSVDGAGLYGDIIRVYRRGKTLYIDFADTNEASRAMDEIKNGMAEGKSIVAVSAKPLNIVDE